MHAVHSFGAGVLEVRGFWEQASDRRELPVFLISILFPFLLIAWKLGTRLLGEI